MANRLANETSPYLLQHANNPVDWYPWGQEALEKARNEDKPIFLSIGYAACHWCHVMEHESFEDPEIAALMNEYFINIKVDREERPDLDAIYMSATVSMTGSGGWPMSVFLTPDLKPFFAGTYFPPTPRYNLPSFRDVLIAIAEAWKNNRKQLLAAGNAITHHLQSQIGHRKSQTGFSSEYLETAVQNLTRQYDSKYGGWGTAPKFPQPLVIEFLLRRATRGDQKALQMALHALDAMAKGGMYDIVGGGFARYSVDYRWHVPHFEKMLYDNAQLILAYLHAYLISGNNRYRKVCEQTLEFLIRELKHPEGGFYSSLDADSEGEEGKFYTWTTNELRDILKDNFDLFKAAHQIPEEGNWEDRVVLQRVLENVTLAETFGLDENTVQTRLNDCYSRLFARRKE
ncbi:MAG: thioredoxin domain-containing protein, partial [Anaerolineales bacterium]